MKVNGVHKPLFVAIASSTHSDLTVDTFCRPIARLQDDCVEDVAQVPLMGFAAPLIGSSRHRMAQVNQHFRPLRAQVRCT